MMRLSELAAGIPGARVIGGDCEISGLCCDVERVERGGLFICVTGGARDRHDDVAEAERRGAAALIVEREVESALPRLVAPDARTAMALAAKTFYGGCIDRMKLIGVTGTNGKTTTCYLIDSILRRAGYRAGLIGTCGARVGDELLETGMTTPDPIELHALFRRMYLAGAEYVVMEVSAHAIYWKKLAGTRAEVAVFTNLTQDHLDFFGSMERYGSVKRGYFTPEYCKRAVVNADDETGRGIAAQARIPVVTYGCREPAEAAAFRLSDSPAGITFAMSLFGEEREVRLAIPGAFNVYNSLAAAACCKLLGVDANTVAEGLAALSGVPGRFSVKSLPGGKSVAIDYAHTPDGLKNLLVSAREICSGRLIVVFGCGGDRDRAKRPIMGEIAERFSDLAVVTSDNPRSEPPEAIIEEIRAGMKGGGGVAIADRKAAIAYAIREARAGDLVVIAGKGHEEYQEIAGVRLRFSDAEAVESCRNL